MRIERQFVSVASGGDGEAENQIITTSFFVFEVYLFYPILPASPAEQVGESLTLVKSSYHTDLFSYFLIHTTNLFRIKPESQV